MSPDKDLVRHRFGRSLSGYDREASVQGEQAHQLVAEILNHGGEDSASVLEIGCGSGLLSRELGRRLRLREFLVNDLVEECGPRVADAVEGLTGVKFSFRPGDIERIDLPPAAFDLVASNAVFHWLDDLAGLLERIADSLRSGGLLAFTTFGPDNLCEIDAVGAGGLPYLSLDEVTALVERRYRILHRRENREVLRFPSPRRVLEHLRRTGANALARAGWTRGGLRAFEREYRERFGSGAEVTLTYHPMLFVARQRGREKDHPGLRS